MGAEPVTLLQKSSSFTETSTKHDTVTILDVVKYTYSTCLLVFSVAIIMALIFSQQTELSQDIHPVFAFVVFWTAILWLNMVEGEQEALVGLPPVDKELYGNCHPIAMKCTTLAHSGNNLDRYLIGRQLMVLIIVFVTNLCAAPLPDAHVFGLPSIVLDTFVGSGLAVIFITTMVGQLNSHVNVSQCMLDYINNNIAFFTLRVALAIELSGLLHCVYPVQMLFAWAAGNPIKSDEESRRPLQILFFWGRVILSMLIFGGALAVTTIAVFHGQTTLWDSIPDGVAMALFFFFMSIVGLLEGMQIAFFAVTKLPKLQRDDHPRAQKTCDLLFKKGNGRNLPRFMIGRQICVTMCFFIIARIITLDTKADIDRHVLSRVPNGLLPFFHTGLLGALITTIAGSLVWQLIASSFPLSFLSNPLVYFFLQICLTLEATGICSGAWVLAKIHSTLAGFKLDEVYIGTPEDRAAGSKPDVQKAQVEPHLGTNVLTLPPGSHDVPQHWLSDWNTIPGPLDSFY